MNSFMRLSVILLFLVFMLGSAKVVLSQASGACSGEPGSRRGSGGERETGHY